jgi:hypothetical protein
VLRAAGPRRILPELGFVAKGSYERSECGRRLPPCSHQLLIEKRSHAAAHKPKPIAAEDAGKKSLPDGTLIPWPTLERHKEPTHSPMIS